MKRPRLPLSCVSGAVIACVVFSSSDARAELVVGGEPHGGVALLDGGDARGFIGLGGTVGYSLDLEPILVAPEGAATFSYFFESNDTIGFRTTFGGRVGVTLPVEPSLYLRGGYGLLAAGDVVSHAFALDTGISVEGRPIRELTIGGNLGYEGYLRDGAAHAFVAAFRIAYWVP